MADYGKPPEEADFEGILRIVGPRAANERVLKWLAQLKATGAGEQLLSKLAMHGGGRTTVAYYDPPTFAKFVTPSLGFQMMNSHQPMYMPVWAAFSSDLAKGSEDANATMVDAAPPPPTAQPSLGSQLTPNQVRKFRWRRGKGVSPSTCLVTWDWASLLLMMPGMHDIDSHLDARDSGMENPGAAIIGHELIHVLHFLRGENLRQNLADKFSTNIEESRTIGMRTAGKSLYEGEWISENAIRHQMGAAMRTDHNSFPMLNLEPQREGKSPTKDVDTNGWPTRQMPGNFDGILWGEIDWSSAFAP